MRLLFIKLKHIGDLLLLSPTLAGVKAAHPDATIWVVARKGTGYLSWVSHKEGYRLIALPRDEKSASAK